MALSDRLDHPPVKPTGKPCSIGEVERALKGKELSAFRQMMYGEPRWSGDLIYEALKNENIFVGRQQVNRHRAGACSCSKRAV